MKALIICLSKEHGNTRKVAEAMAGELNAKLLEPSEVDTESLADYDLIGFGSGIYYGRHYKELRNLVAGLPSQNDKKAFIFSTSGFGFKFWHRGLRKKLVGKGFVIQDEFTCKGMDTLGLLKLFGGVNKGRPNDQDLAGAREFAKELVDSQ